MKRLLVGMRAHAVGMGGSSWSDWAWSLAFFLGFLGTVLAILVATNLFDLAEAARIGGSGVTVAVSSRLIYRTVWRFSRAGKAPDGGPAAG
ncbi:high-affinity Fe2+/Pb2+ permease [Allocatelliglobosispora scoriae]|uniref:High-affinity Fe2+/Pb2+ permease n=1 Tax=Allocatelliglobosispora scoriae TaxID=643052 RepID=A0A841BUY3_9ACTN|nr:hypothetical protein [Allocatelliglobosispora scoriae]MBB5872917.1 high-affinity Fe2+/Pb2+ permease [Allocatelliglobosispora scoriae]